MIRMTSNRYLQLPDWEKVQLKIGSSTYSDLPLMTDEQQLKRKSVILSICAYFQRMNYNAFIHNFNQKTLDGYWPHALDDFVTPRSLDVVNYRQLLICYAKCHTCFHYIGYKGSHLLLERKMHKHRKIIPYIGGCRKVSGNKFTAAIDPEYVCPNWKPERFYEKAIRHRIRKMIKASNYPIRDYENDSISVDLFDYFQDRYRYMDY